MLLFYKVEAAYYNQYMLYVLHITTIISSAAIFVFGEHFCAPQTEM